MKCYQHRSHEAFGICCACGKGLCEECAADLDFALTCKGKCEERAIMRSKLNDNALASYTAQKRNRLFLPLFFILLGLIMSGFGLTAETGMNRWFMILAGLLPLLFGIVLLFLQQALNRKIRT